MKALNGLIAIFVDHLTVSARHTTASNDGKFVNLSARVDAYKYTDAILTTVVYDDAYFLFSRRSLLLMVPPTECDLCYRFRILTLNPNPNHNPKSTNNVCNHAVQNDAGVT